MRGWLAILAWAGLLLGCGVPDNPPRLAPIEGLLGRFLTFAFTTDGAREPASPVPREDPLYAAMQARIDANASQLSLAGRPLADVLATDPGARACWEAARARPLYSMVTPLPDNRFTVLVQIDLRELVAHVQRAR